jgi:hypothetical protein
MSEKDDPEASYRRGFQQGAKAALLAAESVANKHRHGGELTHWADIQLFNWRYKSDTRDRTATPPAPPT